MSGPGARISTTVGDKYRVVRFIAEGGMGAVYEAQHLFVRRRFAIKFLRDEFTRRRDLITRFRREAQAAGALEHENIAAVVDFGVSDDGTPYLVMEYLEGSDLGVLLLGIGPLPVARAADLVLQASIGAHAAHAAGIVHRDLKPQNLFLCRRNDGTDLVKLLDFGIAKLQSSESKDAVTNTGAVLGTPAYMSPEQARGETNLDARTDVYSLGVILYELLSGRHPHPGAGHNAVIHHIATERALPLDVPGVPNELAELIASALSRDLCARPASAVDFAERLRPFTQREAWASVFPPAGPPPPGVGDELTLLASVSAHQPPRALARLGGAERGAVRSNRWLALIALALAVGSGIIAAKALRRPQSPATDSERAFVPTQPPSAQTSPSETVTRAAPNHSPQERAASVEEPPQAARAAPRTVRTPERPGGQLSVAPARVKPTPSAASSDTGANFDNRNPYR